MDRGPTLTRCFIPIAGLGAGGDIPASGYLVRAPAIVKAVSWLTGCAKFDSGEAREVAVSLVIPLHHPVVCAAHKHFYAKAVKNLGVEASAVLANKSDAIIDLLLKGRVTIKL